MLIKAILISLTMFLYSNAFAGSFTGTITSVSGDVKILKLGSSSSGKVLRFEGVTYRYKPARIGRKILPRQVLLTGPNGKAKIVYPNGDQFNVAEGSAFTAPSSVKGVRGESSSNLELIYGKFRSMVSKKGPRNKMIIKTKSAVAGVRGTDFFVSDSGANGAELKVLRGKVAIARAPLSKSLTALSKSLTKKSSIVEKGYTAKVVSTNIPPKTQIKGLPAKEYKEGSSLPATQGIEEEIVDEGVQNNIQISQTTKEELVEVQVVSKTIPEASDESELTEQVKEELKELKQASMKVIVDDIKEDDPDLYDKIKDKPPEEVAKVNQEVVANLFKKAPRKTKPSKLSEDQLKELDKNIYDKYFNLDE